MQSQDPFVLQIRKEISVYVLAGGGRGGGGEVIAPEGPRELAAEREIEL